MIAKRKRNVSFGTRLAAPASRLVNGTRGRRRPERRTANTKPNGRAPMTVPRLSSGS